MEKPSAGSQIGRRVFPVRLMAGLAAVPFGLVLARSRHLFGRHEALGFRLSFALVLLGLALRAWAAACAGGHTRTGMIEAPRLVTGGPYAHVRNPIYLGSFLIGLGMVGLIQDPVLLVPLAVVFAVLIGNIVRAEEAFLSRKFGDEYLQYRASVPRIVPSLQPWKRREKIRATWRSARGEFFIALVLVAIYCAFRIRLGFWPGKPA